MPCVSRFYGIAIYLYYKDHAPPHFHAIYGEDEVVIEIATGKVMAGSIPKRAAKLVDEWWRAHQAELLVDWNLATTGQPLNPVLPLD
jgi:hypothetical protein